MLKIYGTLRCPDCVEFKADLEKAGVEYVFREFDTDLKLLKEFLELPHAGTLFDPVRAESNIGIPCIVREDGTITLSWEEFM